MVRVSLKMSEGGLTVAGLFYHPKLKQPRVVEFVVDTGASMTTISPKDQVHLGIDPVALNLPRSKRKIWTMGGTAPAFTLHDCMVCLFDDKNNDKRMDLELAEVDLLERSPRAPSQKGAHHEAERLKILDNIPSVIGRDVLKAQRLSLHINYDEGTAYLEKS